MWRKCAENLGSGEVQRRFASVGSGDDDDMTRSRRILLRAATSRRTRKTHFALCHKSLCHINSLWTDPIPTPSPSSQLHLGHT